ncbi:MAG: single-stranded DNA-binding protein [Gammaproteobacteria bacterium]|nr:Single-stranded DNA-binding protein [Chlamydiales bacterium]MCH9755529.1 single-stranded DNA-binding protein [Gammaproteobacteria bacterium]
MNLLEIAGFLGADPEERFTSGGRKVVSFRVGVRSGKEDTMWVRVSVWGDKFDRMMPYLKKGSAVIVVGEMQKPEIYTGKDGQPQVSVNMTAEIIKFSPFGKPKSEREQQPMQEPVSSGVQEELVTYGAGQEAGDDLPF